MGKEFAYPQEDWITNDLSGLAGGLTKLEYAAIQIAAGLCAETSGRDCEGTAYFAVRMAKAILKEAKRKEK